MSELKLRRREGGSSIIHNLPQSEREWERREKVLLINYYWGADLGHYCQAAPGHFVGVKLGETQRENVTLPSSVIAASKNII